MKPLPQIVKSPKSQLLVDGEPFLILGLQWDCNSCYSEIEMMPLFEEAKKLGCNTAVTPLYWESIEPEFGQYDFTTVDRRIEVCRKLGLRLVLLWFGGYKNAECCYAPSYIRNDHKTYQKVIRPDGSIQDKTLCPNGEAALERDQLAFKQLCRHLREVDEERTVILIQVENETGIIDTPRCYCPKCNEIFAQQEWLKEYGTRADEAFAAWSLSRYVDRVALAGKEEYPLPLYVNAALGGYPAQRPGRDYFSGGPITRWLSIWQKFASNIDFISPDIYMSSYPVFNRICSEFKIEGNPLYIAETSTDLYGRTEKNVFYAIGLHGAIGFDPWAIDRSFPSWFDPPLVRRYDLHWAPRALDLRDSYIAIGSALKQVALAAGTPRLVTFVEEEGDRGDSFSLGGYEWRVIYPLIDGGRGMLIDEGEGKFILLGTNFMIQPFTPAPDVEPVPVIKLERGHFEKDKWICHAKVTREVGRGEHPIRVEEGQAFIIQLGKF